ncbi:hypothetical protein SM124_05955 [Bacillus sp. 31A1R]|uniref:Uncharacterized protein n=1 Tax=Robertmurraya mangrovi TaxID=3098077 RepID=A0ABU5IVZ8_9BACI|nr:hypothetical protein [Bacillus sp. 31A1R]MDZ5471286.1 hypothetical protein [Bacillus sp. 31A1R]
MRRNEEGKAETGSLKKEPFNYPPIHRDLFSRTRINYRAYEKFEEPVAIVLVGIFNSSTLYPIKTKLQ